MYGIEMHLSSSVKLFERCYFFVSDNILLPLNQEGFEILRKIGLSMNLESSKIFNTRIQRIKYFYRNKFSQYSNGLGWEELLCDR